MMTSDSPTPKKEGDTSSINPRSSDSIIPPPNKRMGDELHIKTSRVPDQLYLNGKLYVPAKKGNK